MPQKQLKWTNEVPGRKSILYARTFPNFMALYLFILIGDFHFLWECLKTVVETFWGSVTQ